MAQELWVLETRYKVVLPDEKQGCASDLIGIFTSQKKAIEYLRANPDWSDEPHWWWASYAQHVDPDLRGAADVTSLLYFSRDGKLLPYQPIDGLLDDEPWVAEMFGINLHLHPSLDQNGWRKWHGRLIGGAGERVPTAEIYRNVDTTRVPVTGWVSPIKNPDYPNGEWPSELEALRALYEFVETRE